MDITDPIYSDPSKAREHLEKLLWPQGPFCLHCGNADPERITKLEGKSTRPGVYKCNECEKPFSVTVGTVFESSHVPLNKWLYAVHKMNSGKKGTSAHQLHRELGVSYKTAWFMAHRIREAMKPSAPAPLGGEGKIVEADETHVGGSGRNRAYVKKPPKKHVVAALVERGGHVRSFHVAKVTAKMLRPILVSTASRKSHLMTDEGKWYIRPGEEFASHHSVNHWQDEYVRYGQLPNGDKIVIHTNTAENYFSILKRGIYGVYQHVSEAHLHRYLAEFDFRYSNRAKLGVNDGERAARAITGARGKRLTYRQPRQAADQ
ncbi:MAG TPA: IS1595 family transposase [Xanthobacteraceae bacterium]